MKSLQKFYFPVVAIAAFLLLAMAQDTQNQITMYAKLDGASRMVVEWEFANPDVIDLSSLLLERRIISNDQPFHEINRCIQDLGGGQFRCEEDLYKESSNVTATNEIVVYRVSVNLKSGGTISKETSSEFPTNAMRRTWGSIKSMFQ